jgi:hypothetical protein
LRRRNAAIAGKMALQRGRIPRGGTTMSEVIPFQKRPSKTMEEETAEFLKLLERIRSEGQKKKK